MGQFGHSFFLCIIGAFTFFLGQNLRYSKWVSVGTPISFNNLMIIATQKKRKKNHQLSLARTRYHDLYIIFISKSARSF